MPEIKNMEQHQGDEIRRYTWIEDNQLQLAEFPTKQGLRAYLSYEFHGDHAEIWVVEMKDGQEVARSNTRYLETIIWFVRETLDA